MAGSLEENVTYFFSVRAETSAGYGTEVADNVTTGANPGKLSSFFSTKNVPCNRLSHQKLQVRQNHRLNHALFLGKHRSVWNGTMAIQVLFLSRDILFRLSVSRILMYVVCLTKYILHAVFLPANSILQFLPVIISHQLSSTHCASTIAITR